MILFTLNSRRPSAEPSVVEPFNIKTNDVLGIRLGMSIADYRLKHKSFNQDCHTGDIGDEVDCYYSLRPNSSFATDLTVGDYPVYDYSLKFYRGTLIVIDYDRVTLRYFDDWNRLRDGLKTKYGLGDDEYDKVTGESCT